jgi:hypothetical protein
MQNMIPSTNIGAKTKPLPYVAPPIDRLHIVFIAIEYALIWAQMLLDPDIESTPTTPPVAARTTVGLAAEIP